MRLASSFLHQKGEWDKVMRVRCSALPHLQPLLSIRIHDGEAALFNARIDAICCK
jgi:hypothetical protein